MKKFGILVSLFVFSVNITNAQLNVSSITDYVQVLNSFIERGVTVSNIQYIGDTNAIGVFSNGKSTNLGIDEGIFLSTGRFVNPSIGSPASAFASHDNYTNGYSLLDSLIPGTTSHDASVLIFDLIPVGNSLEFQYVFGSEEYPEYVGLNFNDVFGFFISGPNPSGGNYMNRNLALIHSSSVPVSIHNVNDTTNETYYVDNEGIGGTTIVFDGFTTVLTAKADVIPSNTYHLIMAIEDAGDGSYDSGVFLKTQSLKSYTGTAGITEISTNEFTAYCNTNFERLFINLQNNFNGSQAIISIYDLRGQLLLSKTTNMAKNEINISLLSKGMYIVRVTAKGIENSKKFIKI